MNPAAAHLLAVRLPHWSIPIALGGRVPIEGLIPGNRPDAVRAALTTKACRVATAGPSLWTVIAFSGCTVSPLYQTNIILE